MTRIRFDLREGDFVTPSSGSVYVAPISRVHVDGAPDYITLPDYVEFPLTDGKVEIELLPTEANWAYNIYEGVDGGVVRCVSVPHDLGVTVDYGDLPDINPATLLPIATPEAAWWAVAADLQAQITAGTGGGGGTVAAVWGTITGTLTAQTDLNTALGLKASTAALTSGLAGKADTATVTAKYTKPGSGIPSTDLTTAVQTSLGKADTAVQPAALTSKIGSDGTVLNEIVVTQAAYTALPTKVATTVYYIVG